jgi:organic radical activating enzyme
MTISLKKMITLNSPHFVSVQGFDTICHFQGNIIHELNLFIPLAGCTLRKQGCDISEFNDSKNLLNSFTKQNYIHY